MHSNFIKVILNSILILIIILPISTNAFSQSKVKYGITAGTGINNLFIDLSNYSNEARLFVVFSYHLGAASEMILTDHLSFNSALRLTSKGSKVKTFTWNGNLGKDEWESTESIRTYYLELPVKFSVDFGAPEGFIISGGFYAGLGLGGRQKFESIYAVEERHKINFTDTQKGEPGTDFYAFESGYVVGVGYKINNVTAEIEWNQSFESVYLTYDEGRFTSIRGGVTVYID